MWEVDKVGSWQCGKLTKWEDLAFSVYVHPFGWMVASFLGLRVCRLQYEICAEGLGSFIT